MGGEELGRLPMYKVLIGRFWSPGVVAALLAITPTEVGEDECGDPMDIDPRSLASSFSMVPFPSSLDVWDEGSEEDVEERGLPESKDDDE